MNTNFGAWTNDKEDSSHDPGEEHIDPTFARHQEEFPIVEDVTAAAVANAQHVNHSQQHAQHAHSVVHHGQHTHQHHGQDPQQSHEEQVRAAAAAAAAAADLQDSDLSPQDLKPRNNRRPVLNTKRAAQNRSAQKAFRQRKEKYIKDLEQQAAEVNTLKQTIEELRAENLQLRDYTLALQSRVIELSSAASQHSMATSQPPPQTHEGSNAVVPAPPASVFNGNKMFTSDK